MSILLTSLDQFISQLPILCWNNPMPPIPGTQPEMWDDLRQALVLISQALHDLETEYAKNNEKIFGP